MGLFQYSEFQKYLKEANLYEIKTACDVVCLFSKPCHSNIIATADKNNNQNLQKNTIFACSYYEILILLN